MSKWKELEIDNLPSDILTGDYEFNWFDHNTIFTFKDTSIDIGAVFDEMKRDILRYRKIKPKAPTHEEIMTKWWIMGVLWSKVTDYSGGRYFFGSSSLPKSAFSKMTSADIPPESE